MNCDIRLYKGSFRPKRQNEKPILQIKYESIKHKHNCPNYGIIKNNNPGCNMQIDKDTNGPHHGNLSRRRRTM